jgi:hypothetical protein
VIAIEDAMGQLIVRGLDDTLIQALKQRAAKRGRAAGDRAEVYRTKYYITTICDAE